MSWIDNAKNILSASQNTFGEDATYTPKTGSPFTVSVIFSNAWVQVETGQGIPTSSQRPTAGVNLNDFASAPTDGDQINIRGKDYFIMDCQEDGEGGALLILQEE